MLVDGKRKVVCVDDQFPWVESFKNYLTKVWHFDIEMIHNSSFHPTVETFDDFENEVMSLIQINRSEIGAVFLDLGLVVDVPKPWEWGFRLEHTIRQEFYELPILAITQYTDDEVKTDGYYHDFDAFLLKDKLSDMSKTEFSGHVAQAIEKRSKRIQMVQKHSSQIKRRQVQKGKRIRVLHISDLHQGMNKSNHLWPQVEDTVIEDLSRLVRDDGPIDVVCFTGDIANRGDKEEFEKADIAISKVLDSLGCDSPFLLAVPGNHDLERPGTDIANSILSISGNTDVANDFWTDSKYSARKGVDKMFAAYSNWFTKYKPTSFTAGLLPGDFVSTLNVRGFKIGVVGVNSSFAHVKKGNLKGEMLYNHRQIHHALETLEATPKEWAGLHDFCILLTHHPVSWYEAKSLREFENELFQPRKFLFHLHGHMHEPNYLNLADGGAAPRNSIQAPSLFGLEEWGERSESRIHGYSVIEIEVARTNTTFRIWPRRLNAGNGERRIVADNFNFNLERFTEATVPFEVSR